MKFLCDACQRLVDVGSFAVHDGALVLECSQCGAESVGGVAQEVRAAVAAPVVQLVDARKRAEAAATAGLPRCPKCGALREEEREDCPKCGLVFALFRPELFELPEGLENLWKELQLDWENGAAHERFVAACTASEFLPEAARRYRIRAEERPADRMACRFRDETISRLMALTAMPPRQEPAPQKKFGLIYALFILMTLVALGVAFWQFLPPLPPPAEAPFP